MGQDNQNEPTDEKSDDQSVDVEENQPQEKGIPDAEDAADRSEDTGEANQGEVKEENK